MRLCFYDNTAAQDMQTAGFFSRGVHVLLLQSSLTGAPSKGRPPHVMLQLFRDVFAYFVQGVHKHLKCIVH